MTAFPLVTALLPGGRLPARPAIQDAVSRLAEALLNGQVHNLRERRRGWLHSLN